MKKTEIFFCQPFIFIWLWASRRCQRLFCFSFCFASFRFDSSFKMCATDSAMHAKQNDFDAFNFRFKFFKRLKSQVLNYKREEMAIHLESPKRNRIIMQRKMSEPSESIVWLLTIYQLLRKEKYFMNVTILTNALFKFVFLHRFTPLFFFLLKYHNMTVYCPNLACALLLQAFLFLVFYSHCSVPRN